jgi:hypothetical protein
VRRGLFSHTVKPLAPSTTLRRIVMRRGLRGSRTFLVIGGLMWTSQITRLVFGKRPQVLAVDKLARGERVEVRSLPLPTRSERRALRRAS